MARFSGRQTQFYIDIAYGIAFIVGFGYLLVFGMEVRVAAVEGGLVLGYFLRVWENMKVYERILEDEIATEAEEAVEEEVQARVPKWAERAVEEELQHQVEDKVTEEAEHWVSEEAEETVAKELEERVETRVDEELDERSSRSSARTSST